MTYLLNANLVLRYCWLLSIPEGVRSGPLSKGTAVFGGTSNMKHMGKKSKNIVQTSIDWRDESQGICLKQMINMGWKGAACPALEGWVGIGLRKHGEHFPWRDEGLSPLAEFVSCHCVYRHSSESGAPGHEAIWPSGWKGKHWDKVTRRDAPRSRGEEAGCSTELRRWGGMLHRAVFMASLMPSSTFTPTSLRIFSTQALNARLPQIPPNFFSDPVSDFHPLDESGGS